MKAVDIVEIEHLIPIFKNGEPANAIEVARVKTREGVSIQYDIIVGKGLHKISNHAVYIQPDYTIPQTTLFAEYHAPFGDPKKCKLGKKGRVRAIKFNFQFEGSTDPIYSNGILLPFDDVIKYIEENVTFTNDGLGYNGKELPMAMIGETPINVDIWSPDFPYQEMLGVEKYVADEPSSGSGHVGLDAGDRPSFLYETDEETIENHKEEVDACYENKEELMFTIKRDGQSVSVFTRKSPETAEWEQGICSRKKLKKLEQKQTTGYKDGEVILHRYFHPDLKIKGWFNDETRTFYTDEEVQVFEPIMVDVRDNWVDTCKEYEILPKTLGYCQKYDIELALRGEVIGSGIQSKKNNYDSKLPSKNIIWFGVDDLSSGRARRIHYGQEHNLIKVCEELGLEYTTEVCRGIFTYDEIIKKAREIFAAVKEKEGKLIEGVVIRSVLSNRLSVKKINDLYDSLA